MHHDSINPRPQNPIKTQTINQHEESNHRLSSMPYPSDMFPGAVHYPDSPKKKADAASNRVSPTSRTTKANYIYAS
jgi:hypothetical protein